MSTRLFRRFTSRRPLRVAPVAAPVLVLTASLTAGAGAGAGPPGRRIVKIIGPAAGVSEITAVTATGARDGRATGTRGAADRSGRSRTISAPARQ